MTGYLIDTNVLSEFTKLVPDPQVMRWLDEADQSLLFVSVITFGEFRLGIEAMDAGKRRAALETWLSDGLPAWFDANLLPVTKDIADQWGRLTIKAKRNGLQLATADGLLAATALQRDLTIVTRNVKDFAGLGVAILNPWNAITTP